MTAHGFAPLLAAALLFAGGAAAESPGAPEAAGARRPLRVLAGDATLIVVGRVHASDYYDAQRLMVHRVRQERVVRGASTATELAVVEIRGGSRLPLVLTQGERALLLLRPAPPLSYLAEQLPAGDYFALVDGRDGVVPIANDAEREALERALAEGAAITALDARTAFVARRRLAFAQLTTPSSRLGADAVVELTTVPNLAPLSSDEIEIVARVLADPKRDTATRIALVELAAARGLRPLVPALSAAASDSAAVQDALWAARARLGAPPDGSEVTPHLESADRDYRSAAVRALARQGDSAALDAVGRMARDDPDPAVRATAIEALGATGSPAALPMLARTFDSATRDLQQRSGQAILKIGGTPAADTLVTLALQGSSSETQAYAALLLVLARGRDDPAVRRLEASGPSAEVRRVLEHGLEFRDTHQH